MIFAACGDAPWSDDEVRCTGTDPVFPSFDKTCAVTSDCLVALHMISCCGSQVAIGIRSSEQARFEDAEARCDAQYPGCGCAQGPTQAEDGKSTFNNEQIVVNCDMGQCMTAVP